MAQTDTIFALSSGPLPAGVAVLRLSGPHARDFGARLCGTLPPPRKAGLRWIVDGDGARIDQAVVLLFEGPNSFTGEDCIEIQCHGGRAVVTAITRTLAAMSGSRPAEAGEFARRAFENGRLDLVEVEGLADLIAAETEMQRRLALQQADGGLSERFADWARRVTRARAMIEAELDFSDEEDVPGSVSETIWPLLRDLADEMQAHLAAGKAAEIVRDGYHVVIIGPPNSGKSSLINYLAQRDIAIVSDIAGTTRDVLSVDLNVDGYLVKVSDTAGQRETDDPLEREGIRRALNSVAQADLVLSLAAADQDYIVLDSPAELIRVRTKSDLGEFPGDESFPVSVKTGAGIDSLTKQIRACLTRRLSGLGVSAVRERQRFLLLEVQTALERAIAMRGQALELVAEALRQAAFSLGKITGQTNAEDLLDVIFAEFCVGK